VRLGMIGALQRLGKALSLGTLFVSSFNWLREILSLLKNVCNKDLMHVHVWRNHLLEGSMYVFWYTRSK
jgi:hypothetical protein